MYGLQKYVTWLGATYHETKQGWGIGGNQFLYEVISSPSGSWTFIVTSLGGRWRLIMAGQNWDGEKHPEIENSMSNISSPM
jgi:hypothetical protein